MAVSEKLMDRLIAEIENLTENSYEAGQRLVILDEYGFDRDYGQPKLRQEGFPDHATLENGYDGVEYNVDVTFNNDAETIAEHYIDENSITSDEELEPMLKYSEIEAYMFEHEPFEVSIELLEDAEDFLDRNPDEEYLEGELEKNFSEYDFSEWLIQNKQSDLDELRDEKIDEDWANVSSGDMYTDNVGYSINGVMVNDWGAVARQAINEIGESSATDYSNSTDYYETLYNFGDVDIEIYLNMDEEDFYDEFLRDEEHDDIEDEDY